MQREMDLEEYKEKREEERAEKSEKARRAKKVYTKGGERALMKGKWPRLTQDWHMKVLSYLCDAWTL
jgi:hypothetical protein